MQSVRRGHEDAVDTRVLEDIAELTVRGACVVPAGEGIYGRLLMTDDELRDYHAAVLQPMTRAERARFFREHRERMEARARERSVTFDENDGAIGRSKLIPPGNGGAIGLGTSNGGVPRRDLD